MADTKSSGGLKSLILAGLVAVLGYFYLEENGSIPHTSETAVTAPKQPQSTVQSVPIPTEVENIDLEEIELFDLEMRASDTRALTGDTRPYYMVSGRIENDSGKTLRSVTIRIRVESTGSPDQADPHYNKDWQIFDQADVEVRGPIPPLMRGFSQQVQLLPPRGKAWTWEANVTRATVGEN